MLIKNVDLNGWSLDVRLRLGKVVEIGSALEGIEVFDAQGGALIPGLHDHHIHLNASAAALNSVKCGPPDVKSADDLIEALNVAGEGWLRGIGYHHSVAGEIDREWLDVHGPNRPIRIQHRGGRMWIMNSLAMEALGISEPQNGRLVDGDVHIRRDADYPDLNRLIGKLHSFGITGVTEVTPSNGIAEFHHYVEKAKGLRLSVMGKAELAGIEDPRVGPLKLHYHEYDLPSLDALTAEVAGSHELDRPIAAHCVTRAELMLTLAAIEGAGAHIGDRIEHAAIADDAAIEWMARLGVTVVAQPNFLAERQEAYRKDVPEIDHKNLWRLAAFDRAGLPMAGGSDAPFGDINPWKAMNAAVNRPKGFGKDEALSPEAALNLYVKPSHAAYAPSRRIEVGCDADLCLLTEPWKKARLNLANVNVKATWVVGENVYAR